MTSNKPVLIRDIVGLIEAKIPAAKHHQTVDTFKCGDPDKPVTGVVVTFMATLDVLKQAVKTGANLVITHEPTFYNHPDETEWLKNDPVFLAKKKFIDQHGLVLWRFHDGLHHLRPDGILQGMVDALGWKMPADPERPNLCRIKPVSLRELAAHCRERLKIGPVRVVGDPDMMCANIGLLPGACGGRRQLDVLCFGGAEVIICGESPEWETCEYVRDALDAGLARGLIVLGHANSEEAGMAHGAVWVRGLLPASVPVHYIPAGDPFWSC
ncbi:MAG: Nif3-like dinuclear metal center hexameric protein [Opitutaceae bacterium]